MSTVTLSSLCNLERRETYELRPNLIFLNDGDKRARIILLDHLHVTQAITTFVNKVEFGV